MTEIDEGDYDNRDNWWPLEEDKSDEVSESSFGEMPGIDESDWIDPESFRAPEGYMVGEMGESPFGEETDVDETDDDDRSSEEVVSGVPHLRANIVGSSRM